jgi:hypothetical protein
MKIEYIDYLDALIGLKVGVNAKSHDNTMFGKLEKIVMCDDKLTGIILDKWGFIHIDTIYRINKWKG